MGNLQIPQKENERFRRKRPGFRGRAWRACEQTVLTSPVDERRKPDSSARFLLFRCPAS